MRDKPTPHRPAPRPAILTSMGKKSLTLLFCLSLVTLLIWGCSQREVATLNGPEASTAPIEIGLMEPTPMPSAPQMPGSHQQKPTPEPDMTFDTSGNIWFSDAMKATFEASVYAFDHPPRVLIYHTHTREAFREPDPTLAPGATATPIQSLESPSPATSATTRSDDPNKTVVYIGDLLAEALLDRGFTVYHDGTDVESPELSTAYARSAELISAYRDIDIYIDLHRNAADAVRGRDDVVMIDGKRTARMFFVVGTGITAESSDNALPNWRENYTFALSVGEQLAKVDPHLVKENRVKQGGYYNQSQGLCLLAEIGHNANLITDAANTVPYFADALAAVCTW